jgi:hypothetical protein
MDASLAEEKMVEEEMLDDERVLASQAGTAAALVIEADIAISALTSQIIRQTYLFMFLLIGIGAITYVTLLGHSTLSTLQAASSRDIGGFAALVVLELTALVGVAMTQLRTMQQRQMLWRWSDQQRLALRTLAMEGVLELEFIDQINVQSKLSKGL